MHDVPVTHYDLAVIGTGSGNTVVTQRVQGLGKVAIIEEHLFGGTCLNVGCIPTKMFVYPADLARLAQHGPALGVRTSYDGARWPEIRDRIFGRIDPRSGAVRPTVGGCPTSTSTTSTARSSDDHTLRHRLQAERSPPTRS